MEIVCLDLEGVLVPEIWIAFAEETGIPELKRTTRDEPDYDKLMKYRIGILKEHGFRIENIDATLLCQRPKLAPYIPAMRQNLADAFGLPVDAVSVKATTEEHLGFTGEGLGIAAHAVALIETL